MKTAQLLCVECNFTGTLGRPKLFFGELGVVSLAAIRLARRERERGRQNPCGNVVVPCAFQALFLLNTLPNIALRHSC